MHKTSCLSSINKSVFRFTITKQEILLSIGRRLLIHSTLYAIRSYTGHIHSTYYTIHKRHSALYTIHRTQQASQGAQHSTKHTRQYTIQRRSISTCYITQYTVHITKYTRHKQKYKRNI